MKLKKIEIKKQKLLKLNFINTKLYKKTDLNFITLQEIIVRLKQALQLIYKYHTNNKRILFVGFFDNTTNKIEDFTNNTNHIFLPNFIWTNGLITNKKPNYEYILKSKISTNQELSKTLFKFQKKIDLVVLIDSIYEENILNESYNLKIPTISLTNSLNKINTKSSYKVMGNLNFTRKNLKHNFFYLILNSLLKRGRLFKKFELSLISENLVDNIDNTNLELSLISENLVDNIDNTNLEFDT